MSGAGLGGQDAASATSNSTAGRRIPQPPHAKVTGRWLASSNPCIHAAQQIGPFASVRQEITPCLVWSFPLNLGLRVVGAAAAVPHITVAAPTQRSTRLFMSLATSVA